MPERLKGMVSKTIMGQPIEGSNPSFSSEKEGFEAEAASGDEANQTNFLLREAKERFEPFF